MTEFIRRFLSERRHAYQVTFKGPIAKVVLSDLARFCRANESTYHEDARLHALAEGRREVWLRIRHHLDLPPDELLKLYSGDE